MTIKRNILLLFVLSLSHFTTAIAQKTYSSFRPGEVWTDTDGNPINAHGGGILYHNGVYYWYGECKKGKPSPNDEAEETGVSCYSSTDLMNWRNEGVVLPTVKDDPNHDLYKSNVLERPKVIYNPKSRKFVMWMHIDSPNYGKACAGIAVADSPTEPFQYIGSFRPNDSMSRDQTVFVDDNGQAYQFCSSEENSTMHINLLTDDYLSSTSRFTRNFVQRWREAPAVFKYDGKYYVITSGCTGWDPNKAEIAVADSIMGEWKAIGNPCVGEGADKTFLGQSTFVLPVQGQQNAFIAMFDRWNKNDLKNSRYLWLPIIIKDGTITIPWLDEWDLSVFEKSK